jgi:hypothetical protein
MPINLKTAYGFLYKITFDPAAAIEGQSKADRLWLQQIPCKYGHIFVHGHETLGAYAKGRLITGKLAALPGVRVHQRGDSEVSVVFSPEVFPAVADLLQARRRCPSAGARHLIGHRFTTP